MSDKKQNNRRQANRGRGRPPIPGRQLRVTFRLRQGRSPAEDGLLERLDQLPARHRSRFIRRVLTTGDIDPILDRELARESARVGSALDALATYYDEGDDNEF